MNDLTYTAIGVYTIMLSNSKNGVSNIIQKDLINKANGKTKVSTAINELIKEGYIEKIKTRENGKISGIKYKILK